jgi:dihydrodipicolinate synthase/N-acetylneuraminate lyase
MAGDLTSHLSGVLCATITPFVPDTFEVDWPAIRHNVQWLIERGVTTLVVNGSIGEHAAMTATEQTRAVAETVAAAAGQASVIAGCSDANPSSVVDLCAGAAAAGADGVLLLAPYYFRLSPVEVLDFFRWVDGCIDLPFVLYDNPLTGRAELPVETIEAISGLHRFAGLKEASPDVLRFYHLVERFAQRFPVVAAVEDPLLFMLVAGASGCMTASAAFAPQLLRDLMCAVDSGDLQRARAVFGSLSRFRALFAADIRAGRPAFVAYTKAAVDMVGGRAGPTRPPLRPLDAAERSRLRTTLTDQVGLVLPPILNPQSEVSSLP